MSAHSIVSSVASKPQSNNIEMITDHTGGGFENSVVEDVKCSVVRGRLCGGHVHSVLPANPDLQGTVSVLVTSTRSSRVGAGALGR